MLYLIKSMVRSKYKYITEKAAKYLTHNVGKYKYCLADN